MSTCEDVLSAIEEPPLDLACGMPTIIEAEDGNHLVVHTAPKKLYQQI